MCYFVEGRGETSYYVPIDGATSPPQQLASLKGGATKRRETMEPTIKAIKVDGIYMVWDGAGWIICEEPPQGDIVGELLDLLYGRQL